MATISESKTNYTVHSQINDGFMDYNNKLSGLILELNTIDGSTPLSSKREKIRGFMRQIGELYLDFFQENLDISVLCGKKHGEILQRVIEDINVIYVGDLEKLLIGSFEDNEWIRVCVERTNIEAFNAMFNGIVEPLDTEEIEDKMRQCYEYIPEADVPHGIPREHWWWFTTI
ncbi:MAG: hypothetical protein KDK96_08525 [Chlamydiia bacterium]|nr:hypothetical protein [Chlamydiia bacterium]